MMFAVISELQHGLFNIYIDRKLEGRNVAGKQKTLLQKSRRHGTSLYEFMKQTEFLLVKEILSEPGISHRKYYK